MNYSSQTTYKYVIIIIIIITNIFYDFFQLIGQTFLDNTLERH